MSIKTVAKENLLEEVQNLDNEELSVNLLPLGLQLATSDNSEDRKNAVLVAEAGIRLSGSEVEDVEEDENAYSLMVPEAKALILHALDRYISEGCTIPPGCSHFDDFDGPTNEEKTLALIEAIENSEGVALFLPEFEDEGEDENELGLDFSNLEQYSAQFTEETLGVKLTPAMVDTIMEGFKADLIKNIEEGTNKYETTSLDEVDAVVETNREILLANLADRDANRDANRDAGTIALRTPSEDPEEFEREAEEAARIASLHTLRPDNETGPNLTFRKQAIEFLYNQPISPAVIEQAMVDFAEALTNHGIPERVIRLQVEKEREQLYTLL